SLALDATERSARTGRSRRRRRVAAVRRACFHVAHGGVQRRPAGGSGLDRGAGPAAWTHRAEHHAARVRDRPALPRAVSLLRPPRERILGRRVYTTRCAGPGL